MQQPLIASRAHPWILPLIRGCTPARPPARFPPVLAAEQRSPPLGWGGGVGPGIQVFLFVLGDQSFDFALISRRSRFRAGTRYLTRGVDDVWLSTFEIGPATRDIVTPCGLALLRKGGWPTMSRRSRSWREQREHMPCRLCKCVAPSRSSGNSAGIAIVPRYASQTILRTWYPHPPYRPVPSRHVVVVVVVVVVVF